MSHTSKIAIELTDLSSLESACKKLGEAGAAARVAKKILETANEEL